MKPAAFIDDDITSAEAALPAYERADRWRERVVAARVYREFVRANDAWVEEMTRWRDYQLEALAAGTLVILDRNQIAAAYFEQRFHDLERGYGN